MLIPRKWLRSSLVISRKSTARISVLSTFKIWRSKKKTWSQEWRHKSNNNSGKWNSSQVLSHACNSRSRMALKDKHLAKIKCLTNNNSKTSQVLTSNTVLRAISHLINLKRKLRSSQFVERLKLNRKVQWLRLKNWHWPCKQMMIWLAMLKFTIQTVNQMYQKCKQIEHLDKVDHHNHRINPLCQDKQNRLQVVQCNKMRQKKAIFHQLARREAPQLIKAVQLALKELSQTLEETSWLVKVKVHWIWRNKSQQEVQVQVQDNLAIS